MLIASFGPSSGWAGKTITREGEVFTLEGHGPITAADVMEYDRQGQLVWANEGTRAWVGAKARGGRAAPETSSSVLGAEPRSTLTATTSASGTRRPPLTLVLVVVVIVAAAIMVSLLATGVLGGGKAATTAATWPEAFDGTWKVGPDEYQRFVFGSGPGEATITMVSDDGSEMAWQFAPDQLTWTSSGGPPIVLTRTSSPAPDFTGRYESAVAGASFDVSYAERQLTVILQIAAGDTSQRSTFTLSPDGKTLTVYDSTTGESFHLTRQQ